MAFCFHATIPQEHSENARESALGLLGTVSFSLSKSIFCLDILVEFQHEENLNFFRKKVLKEIPYLLELEI